MYYKQESMQKSSKQLGKKVLKKSSKEVVKKVCKKKKRN